MSKKYQVLFFDADMTLLDFNKSMSLALQETFIDAGIEYSLEREERYAAINDSYWKRLERGEVTHDELAVGRFKDFVDSIGYTDRTAYEINNYYIKRLALQGHLLPGALDFLDKVDKSFRMYLITNGSSDIQRSRIKLAKLDKYFQNIFISGEVGANKPSKEYFDYVFNVILETDRSKMLIIGDSLTSDIKGGTICGIDTCWYNPTMKNNFTDITPTYTAYSYEDILNIINLTE